MISPDDSLRTAWQMLSRGGHAETADLLVSRHAEPHRRYHTATHVMWVLRHADEILSAEHRIGVDADAIRAAALFHDIVYDPRSSTNEADSAGIAAQALTDVGWDEARVSTVRTLIEATATHEARTFEAEVLLDADLAVLGARSDAYRAYVDDVRYEYGFIDDASWRVGRAVVLRSFLDRDQIYATPTMFDAREPQARYNLGHELAALSG